MKCFAIRLHPTKYSKLTNEPLRPGLRPSNAGLRAAEEGTPGHSTLLEICNMEATYTVRNIERKKER
jgi:hypothetical protein